MVGQASMCICACNAFQRRAQDTSEAEAECTVVIGPWITPSCHLGAWGDGTVMGWIHCILGGGGVSGYLESD